MPASSSRTALLLATCATALASQTEAHVQGGNFRLGVAPVSRLWRDAQHRPPAPTSPTPTDAAAPSTTTVANTTETEHVDNTFLHGLNDGDDLATAPHRHPRPKFLRGRRHRKHVQASTRDMANHGGPVMVHAQVQPVFWGPGWSNPGDKISGLTQFYNTVSGSGIAAQMEQYMGGLGAPSITASPPIVDLSPVAPFSNGGEQAMVGFNKVCSMLRSKTFALPAATDLYVPIYLDVPRPSWSGFCAFHTYGQCMGSVGLAKIKYAIFFNLDNDGGCTFSTAHGARSQGLTNLGKISLHELAETQTDPLLNAWYIDNASGAIENGDACNDNVVNVPLSDGSVWALQSLWDNSRNACTASA